MRSFLKTFGSSFLDLIYPPLCLHCNEGLEKGHHIFCRFCLAQLEMIDPLTRCPACFTFEFNAEMQKYCQQCKDKPKNIKHIASVFDYEGAPSTFVKHLKYGGKSYLAKSGGAFLSAQFLTLGWPVPDFIIPMPMARLRRLERGYNQSELLAHSFAQLIDRPVLQALKRKSGDFSQAGLNHQQRLQLKSDSFFIHDSDKERLYDKTVLLIDDVMTTGSSLNCCAEALSQSFPQAIYALTLCRTL